MERNNILPDTTIFDDASLTEKLHFSLVDTVFTDELNGEFKRLIALLEKMCITAREKGYNALVEHSDEEINPVFNTILYFVIKNKDVFKGESTDLLYWIKPMLLSHKIKGAGYIKSILIYEGIRMIIYQGLSPELLKFRLNCIIGNFLPLI